MTTPRVQDSGAGDTRARPHRLRKWLLRGLVATLVLVIGVELFARFALGLGDPPLYRSDPELGYTVAPGRYHHLHNTITINSALMRCPELPQRKSTPGELRVLVMGDSIIYGGSQTDDADLATARLELTLAGERKTPVRVANIAVGSWCAGNLLAYARRFGTFDADAAVLVFNSLDYGAVVRPGLSWALPQGKPWLALEEGVQRFLARRGLGPQPSAGVDEYNPTPQDAQRSLDDLRGLIDLLRARGVAVVVVQFPKLSELQSGYLPGHQRLLDQLTSMGVPVIQAEPAIREAMNRGVPFYRDDIHPTPQGQQVLGTILEQAVKRALADRPPSPPG